MWTGPAPRISRNAATSLDFQGLQVISTRNIVAPCCTLKLSKVGGLPHLLRCCALNGWVEAKGHDERHTPHNQTEKVIGLLELTISMKGGVAGGHGAEGLEPGAAL